MIQKFFIISIIGIFFYSIFNMINSNIQKDEFSEINFIKDENERIQQINKKVEDNVSKEKYASALFNRATLNLNLMNFKDAEDDLKILMEFFKKKPCKTKEDCDDYLNSISLYGNLYYELDVNSKDKSRQNFYYKELLNESKRLKSKDHEIFAKILIDSEDFFDRDLLFSELIYYMEIHYPNSIELANTKTLAAINLLENEKYNEAAKLIDESDILMQKKAPLWDSFSILNQVLKYKIDFNNEKQVSINDLNKTLSLALMSPKLNYKNLLEINFMIAEIYRYIGNKKLSSQYFKNSFDLVLGHPIIPNSDFFDAGFRYLHSLIENDSSEKARAIANLIIEHSKSNELIEEHPSILIPVYYYHSIFLMEDDRFVEALYYLDRIINFEESYTTDSATRDYILRSKKLLQMNAS